MKIYKIYSKDIGTPKIELIKILYIGKKTIIVQSIYDNYIFSYDKTFFKNEAQKATKTDVKKYRFELN